MFTFTAPRKPALLLVLLRAPGLFAPGTPEGARKSFSIATCLASPLRPVSGERKRPPVFCRHHRGLQTLAVDLRNRAGTKSDVAVQ
jgi:hypothetical protein